MRHGLLLIILLILSSCGGRSEEKGFPVKVDLDDAKEGKISEFFALKGRIDLETTQESVIGNIEKVILLPEEDRVVVLDGKRPRKVLLFDYKGKFLRQVGSPGEGPGEYYEPNDICYAGKEIVVYSKSMKLLYFTPDGDYIDELNMRGKGWNFSIDYLDELNGEIYGYSNLTSFCYGQNGEKCRVIKISNKSEITGSFGDPEEDYPYKGGAITAGDTSVYYSDLFGGNIYEIIEGKDSEREFIKLGELCDTEDLKKAKNKLKYIMENRRTLKTISYLRKIGDDLLICTCPDVYIFDGKKRKITRKLSYDLSFKGYKWGGMRLLYQFYRKGIVYLGIDTSRITDTEYPNPSLFLMEYLPKGN